ncbi:lipoprotein [Hydrogenovibrio sp. JE_KL2]|uniref:LPS translocon maturation chaperone LptM n=1 Tax=Hydrogenovibrio sp. JE_KL2 TaxID=2651188 RepID=UPI00128C6F8C|nr:lipoprotein [Hydrogenovibrio sp. JE_KL2]MPQ77520.1 lipoprotein [Hydrogenovibrio sp. JE_KL2]MPQ96319.1 lipoprotein [Thioclava sp. JE_KL1]
MNHFSQIGRFLLLSALMTLLLAGCGRKAPLYIPTDAQKAQMEKDQAERDAVLKAREERAQKASEAKTATDAQPTTEQ